MKHVMTVLRLVLLSGFACAHAAHAFDPSEGAGSTASGATSHRSASGFNPNEGAETTAPARYAPARPMMAAPVSAPAQPVALVRPPVPVAPMPAAAPVRMIPAEQQSAMAAPAYQTPAPVAYVAPVAPAYEAPPVAAYAAAVQPVEAYAPAASTAIAPRKNQFSLGIQGFYDEYKEDSVGLTDRGAFGGITASYTHYFNPQWYGMVDLSAAYGNTDYQSVSGTIDAIPQWETDNRLLAGYDYSYGNGTHLKPYIGLGGRYFSDELKGKISSTGALGYDRRIFQLYLPIGVTYEFAAYGLNFAPNLELDPLLWGNVSSRLGTIPGFSNIENRQTTGLGIRGEFLMGRTNAQGQGWQFGPFFRYWNMPDSDVDGGFIEPENTRLQAGAKFKLLF